MVWGQQIGSKFDREGKPMRYPGNTVISDLRESNPAFSMMDRARGLLQRSALASHFILLPRDSYHMTVIRGLNDHVRADGYWPDALPRDTLMQDVDTYVASAVRSVAGPGSIRMRFGEVVFDDADVRVQLLPSDEEQTTALSTYRDAVADALGLRLPGHNDYRYHLTLAYMLRPIPTHKIRELNALKATLDEVLTDQPEVTLDPPYMAYYQDMYSFEPEPIARDLEGEPNA